MLQRPAGLAQPTMDDDALERAKKAYDVARETRGFEIELFWKRALFFWAFVAAAFAAFGSVYKEDSALALMVSGLGAVCSIAWTLANRGSKYWQQTWEARVATLEIGVTGPLFDVDAPVLEDSVAWLRARRFSVSKLTIALSDFIALLWSFLVAGQLLRVLGFETLLREYTKSLAVAFVVFVVVYIGAIAIWCRTSPRGARPLSHKPTQPPGSVDARTDSRQAESAGISFAP